MAVRFAEFTLDEGTREVRRDGVALALEPKAFAVLSVLLGERPRAVPKAAIHTRVWPDTFVSESHLSSLVAEVRLLLGDDPRNPRFIRTVHGFGYAFCGAAEEVASAPAPASRLRLLGDRAEYLLLPGENLVGRADDALVRLPSSTASRRHARILVGTDGAELEDLGSKNGTLVAGERLRGTRRRLHDGDEIVVGGLHLVFRELDPGDPTRTEA